jgi:hypothetical protein
MLIAVNVASDLGCRDEEAVPPLHGTQGHPDGKRRVGMALLIHTWQGIESAERLSEL